MKKVLLSFLLAVSMIVMAPAVADTCDPVNDADPSCGLKAAVEAVYGEGYCATLYAEQDTGGTTLEVYQRYTGAGIDAEGNGYFDVELFPTILDDDCSIKTTYALEGQDPTFRFYTGITLGVTTDITTTPGEEEITTTLNPDAFQYRVSTTEFAEHQLRFDSNFYDEGLINRYDSTNQQDYFSPAIPPLTISIAPDGTISWAFPIEVASSDIRADVYMYEITDTGLEYVTFTSKYSGTTSWKYYDWNNVPDGQYLLAGTSALKVYYDDVYLPSANILSSLSGTTVVNQNYWNETVYYTFTVNSHVVEDVASATIDKQNPCLSAAEDGEDCSALTSSDLFEEEEEEEDDVLTAPTNKPVITKAGLKNGITLKKKASYYGDGCYYKIFWYKGKGKSAVITWKNVTKKTKSLSKSNKKKLKKGIDKGTSKNRYVRAKLCNSGGCGPYSQYKKFNVSK